MHRRSEQIAAVAQRDAIIAARVAEAKSAEEKTKAQVAAAHGRQGSGQAGPIKAEQAKAAAKAAEKQKLAEAEKAGGGQHHHHHGKASAKGKGAGGSAVASKGGERQEAGGPKSTRDNAAIDKLLASFK